MFWKLWDQNSGQRSFDPLEFRMKFKAGLACFVFVAIFSILILMILQKDPAYYELIKSIVTFMLGGVLGAIVTYYFDGNEGSFAPPEVPRGSQESKTKQEDN